MSERSADREIDYLADQLTRIENTMVDPQQFGLMQGEVHALRRDMDRVLEGQETMAAKMDQIAATLAEARGGWKLLMLAGGSGAVIGALADKLPGVLGGLIK